MDLPAAVALVNTIPELVLAGNPVTLKFQASDNLVETEGVPASITLTWTAAAIAGEYFDLLLAGETVRFTCAAAPDNSGEQFHDNSGSLALAAWVAIVAADLRTNYLIARYYTITASGATMIITANEAGDDYSQEFTAGTGIDVTAVETSKTGVAESLRAFYAIAVLLYCDDEFVTEILLNTDDEGYAEADVSKLLEAYLTSAFTFPESGSSLINSHSGNIKTWYFKYGERWGDGEYTAMVQSSTYYVMTGGISWMLLAKYNAASESFWSQLQESKKFLSWAPLTRTIVPDEILKLYFLNHSAATTLTVRAELFTASGSIVTTVATINGAIDMGVYEFILSPAVIPYSGLTTETLLRIDVWIEDEDSEVISEVRTYQIDYTHYEHTRYFMFKNSFGVFEVLRTTGLMTTVDDYSRQSASAQVEYDYETDEREEKSIQNIEQQKFKVAAGWLSKFADAAQYRNWLRDFSLSKEVYLVDGEVLKPIELTDTSLDHSKDRDTLATFSFEFINAFTDEFYSESEEEEETPDLIPEVNAGLYGLLYNHPALVDARNIAAAGWHVSTTADWSDLIVALGGTVAAGYYANIPNDIGGKLKQTGTQFWLTPNTGATNESRFHARAAGWRLGTTGSFFLLQQMASFWALDTALQACQYYIMYESGQLSSQMLAETELRSGFSVRLVKDTTNLLPGQTGIYTGNDGKQYVSICIGTKEWLLYNLSETKFRNGDSIAEVTGNAEWAALDTPALCAPNNYWGYVSDLSAAQEAFSEDFSNDFKRYEN